MIMKRLLIIALTCGLIFGMSNFVLAECVTIQDGTLLTTDGRVITTGYDEWGYNYQAHMFNGGYCDAYRDATWCHAYRDIDLMMKWNNAWLSNMDCDDDDKLDRHFGYPTYIGSGAWLTNHQSGKVDVNGKMRKWTYFVKIVAAPSDAKKIPVNANGSTIPGIWYTVDNIEIGPVIWGAFAIIQQVSNDPSAGEHGILYNSPAGPGFGIYGAEGE
jgi:hypothetical protein